MKAINRLIDIAEKEVGYLEKKNKNALYEKTSNAGKCNYTKYWEEIKPDYQGQAWCACFVTWCFVQAFGMSAFGVELMSINPIFTFLVCMLPRILMGWCCGLIFKAFKNKDSLLPYFTASVSGALLNTLFFMTALLALFGNCE